MTQRRLVRIWRTAALLLVIALIVKTASFFPLWIEKNYTNGVYPFISAFLRLFFGWLPLSIGDVLYGATVIWLIIQLVKIIIAVVGKKVTGHSFLAGVGRFLQLLLIIYIWFNILWGLNYDRLGIGYQLKLAPGTYSTEELKFLTHSLIIKANDTRKALKNTNVNYPPYQKVFSQSVKAYEEVTPVMPFLKYDHRCLKRSLYSRLGNYLGFLGYYNPFTGEAQVNVKPPPFLVPFVTCHEIAHQLGYGTEDEANFVSYLATKASSDKIFNYSAYFDLFTYANGELFTRDSLAARENVKLLDTLVRKDLRTYREFLKAHRNPVEPLITAFYSLYLQANNQPKGLATYSDVVALLIAYQKKYGEL
jgi:hypothetical protein